MRTARLVAAAAGALVLVTGTAGTASGAGTASAGGLATGAGATTGAGTASAGGLATGAGAITGTTAAGATTGPGAAAAPVTGWAARHAVPLATVDPAAPVDDLAFLRRSVGRAQVVGLGESVHGAAEEETLKHRLLRFLVERMGFRSVAWEEDWTTGLAIDRYVTTGAGDPDALVRRMSPQWQSREVAGVLRWLRAYNARHAEKVRFVGVDYYLLGREAYDAVEAYVARTAPARLPALRAHLRAIRPPADVFGYVQDLLAVPDKTPYVRHARAIRALVAGLPAGPGHALALQHARQIVSFYEHYALPQPPASDSLVYRDAHAAANLRWWRDHTGDRIAYWGASAHTANVPRLRFVLPGPDWRYPTTGSYLRRWYGDRYVSIGVTLGSGAVSLGPAQSLALPPPRPGWFERPLVGVPAAQFALDLRAPAPPAVRRWLAAPLRTRGLPGQGPDAYLAGGTLAGWFDVVVHRQRVSPVAPV
jgi:erythromycin esterase-like protein